MATLRGLIWLRDGAEPTHGSQMIGEWEEYTDGAGSITESGRCESQFPKNSNNMYATAREGECGAETYLEMCSSGGDAQETTSLWGLKLVICDQTYEGLWAEGEVLER